MPTNLPKDAIERADAAVAFAQQVRRYHRRRREPVATRTEELQVARDRLAEAMKPLRSEIGRFIHGPQTDIAEANRTAIREASGRIQVERRKLTKMMKAQVSE